MPATRDPPPLGGSEQLFIVKRGWHIDIGVAVKALDPQLRIVRAQLPQARYLLFGFGDRRYLTARSKRLDALLAALRPGPALILLTGLSDTPRQAFGARAVRVLPLAPRQMQAVQAFIWQTLARAHGLPVRVQPGPYAGSVYLAAQPRYSGLHTCNSWAAEALRAGGLPVHVRGVVFAWQLWRQLPRLRRAQGQLRASPPSAHRAGSAAHVAVRARSDQLQGGREPSWQTTVV
ncbi:MAG TPA: DUF2459 domain-containing protein [Steroidobacteraceae bacterium]|nr:DUF2459 domain-containing protein [Steroidobacteraceae bacterium]